MLDVSGHDPVFESQVLGTDVYIVNIKDLSLDDPWSDVRMPIFMMTYDSVEAFRDFIGLVKIDADIEESVVDFRTIAYFSPTLFGNRLILDVKSGGFEGTVDDFFVKKIQVASKAGGFEGTITGRMTGIPEIEQTSIDARINDFKLTSAGLSHFVSEWMREGCLDLGHMAPGTTFKVTAHASGPLNNLAIDTDIRSAIGQVDGNIRLDDLIA